MSVALESKRTIGLFDRADRVESVAETMTPDDPRREELLKVVAETLDDAEPVRAVVAADILRLNEKTVRAWASEGVLRVRSHEPRLLLDATSLHAVARLVADLRAAGHHRGLLDEVYRRLSDRALLDRDDLTESLGQMKRGQGRVVRSGRSET